MFKFMRVIVGTIFILLLITSCTGDSTEGSSKELNIYDTWVFVAVVDEDDEDFINELGEGFFIKIFPDHILEMLGDSGNRRHASKREGNILKVISAGQHMDWQITIIDENNIRLTTPIGIYFLERSSNLH